MRSSLSDCADRSASLWCSLTSAVRFASSDSKRDHALWCSRSCLFWSRRNASSALNCAIRAKSFTPSRSRISARLSSPAPEHNGHSIFSDDVDRIDVLPLRLPSGEELRSVEKRDRRYFLRISRPGSEELMDIKVPCASRTVLKRSLVRPA